MCAACQCLRCTWRVPSWWRPTLRWRYPSTWVSSLQPTLHQSSYTAGKPASEVQDQRSFVIIIVVIIITISVAIVSISFIDTSTNWRQSLLCCCTASMEQATDGAETAAIDGLVSSWSENISVSFIMKIKSNTTNSDFGLYQRPSSEENETNSSFGSCHGSDVTSFVIVIHRHPHNCHCCHRQQTQTKVFSVSFSLWAPGYGLTLWCPVILLVGGRNTSASFTVAVAVDKLTKCNLNV